MTFFTRKPADHYEIKPGSKKITSRLLDAFLLGILGGLLLAIIVGIYFATLEYGGASRDRVSRVKSDLRTLQTALEAYFSDHNSYPISTDRADENIFIIEDPAQKAVYNQLPTFMIYRPGLATLTTPVSYITTYFDDPFGPEKHKPFCYWAPKEGGWIMWSAGPDGHYDLNIDNIARVYDPKKPKTNGYLINLTYDPTNGSKSGGDIYRMKQ